MADAPHDNDLRMRHQLVQDFGCPEVERAIHLHLLNRGVLLTPFHNMMLCSPETTTAHADTLLRHLGGCLRELAAA